MTTRTWAAGGADNKASTAGNWDGTPEAGDDLVVGFDSRGIDWDLAVSPGAVTFQGDAAASGNMAITLSVNQVFTGALLVKSLHATSTVTLATSTHTLTCGALTLGDRGCLSQTGTAGNVTCTSYTQSGTGSVLTGKVDAWFYCSGNCVQTGGTIFTSTVNWYFTGSGVVTLLNAKMNKMDFESSRTVGGLAFSNILKIGYGFNVTILNNARLGTYSTYTAQGIDFQGNITTNGNGYVFLYGAAGFTNTIPAINQPSAKITFDSFNGLDYSFTCMGDVTVKEIGSLVGKGANSFTLDLNGHNLTTNTIPIGVGGILLGGEGVITVNGGAFDSSAGTFTKETSTVVLNGASTIKTNGTDEFHNLITTDIRTLASNVTIGHYYVHARDEVLAGFTLSLTDATLERNCWELYPVVNPVVNPVMTGTNYCLRYIGR